MSSFSVIDCVRLEIKNVPLSVIRELKEFLRTNVIHPIKSVDVENNGHGYFDGFFTPEAAEGIQKWLQEKGINHVSD